ncbi:uncharacterized protein KY384_006730 [Bacidia gigantensis]|uniref:uncharacterized protein n=1 Tax=Bacidia gigantensis TaxID=2732470 RepID=UPI001D03B384|nr:uncharacterized protein KY384_006730 [Bacidia gigantensis]KAG8528558.1 hypothetical protein KY384_006730 [Bacidia gigantensis]
MNRDRVSSRDNIEGERQILPKTSTDTHTLPVVRTNEEAAVIPPPQSAMSLGERSNIGPLVEPTQPLHIETEQQATTNISVNSSSSLSRETSAEVAQSTMSLGEGSENGTHNRPTESLHPEGRRLSHVNPFNQSLRTWWLELAACVIAILAISGVVATLRPHQGKPLPQWPYHLTVNTLLSIYMTVLRGVVVTIATEGLGQLKWSWLKEERPIMDITRYDAATRGPLGALTLLWHLRTRNLLSSTGAVIALLILIVDPFGQQIIHYYTCSVAIDHLQAEVPRTNVFLPEVFNGPGGASGFTVEPALQAAVPDGALGSGINMNALCPSTNCTFPEQYSTVAYCSSCTDTSDLLSTYQSVVPANDSGIRGLDSVVLNGAMVNFTQNISSSSSLLNRMTRTTTTSNSTFTISSGPGTDFNITAMRTYGVFSQDRWDTPRGVEMIVAQQFKLFDPKTGNGPVDCENHKNSDFYCRGFGSTTCTIEPCIRTYETKVEGGVLQEQLVGMDDPSRRQWGWTQEFPVDSSGPPLDPNHPSDKAYIQFQAILDLHCLSDEERQNLSESGHAHDMNQRWLAYNATFNPSYTNFSSSSPFPESMMVHGCVYVMLALFDSQFWLEFLGQFFTGSVIGTVSLDNYFANIEALSGPPLLQHIYNYGNTSFERIDSIFKNISDSITAYIRQSSAKPPYNKPAVGIVMHDQTCLAVRWNWLIFPALVAAMALIFFICTIVRTRSSAVQHVPLWKSSPLPFLLRIRQDPDATLPEGGGSHSSIAELESDAKDWKVKVESMELGFARLVKDNTSSVSREMNRPEV